MCLLIAKIKGIDSLPSESQFQQAYSQNYDGIGVAFSPEGSKWVSIHKFSSLREFLAYHKNAPYRKNTAEYGCIFHFRFATSGGRGNALIHPFPVKDTPQTGFKKSSISRLPVLAHNGVLHHIMSEPGESDTLTFTREILAPLKIHRKGYIDPPIKRLLELAIGEYNKMSLLYPGGYIELLHAKSFHEREGIYYSNYSYIVPKTLKPPHLVGSTLTEYAQNMHSIYSF